MGSFSDFKLVKQLNYAIDDLGFDKPTPIQKEAFSVVLSGKDIVGVAQTGTGKTLAYMLPILQELKFSTQLAPRVAIMVPTRELVLQVVENIESFAKYISLRVVGVYGGTNINTQMQSVAQGADIVVGTPGRFYDLSLSGALKLKAIKKLVIDEVDVMMDLGFLPQLTNIFELLPEKRQNIMFSATMTEEVDALIDDFFIVPTKIAIAVSGTPLENIVQQCYPVPNFYTKVNLLTHLIKNKTDFRKVLIFVSSKKIADRLFDSLEGRFGSELGVIHSNKSQNYRIRSVEQFDSGVNRILLSTDVMARGLDLEKITHVINFDTPTYPENYMHRIGRTGRAEEEGNTILFYTEKETENKEAIEDLMKMKILTNKIPKDVEVSRELIPEEQPRNVEIHKSHKKKTDEEVSYHQKSEKNSQTNQGGSYRRIIAQKYKKRKTRGDKNFGKRKGMK
jgi:ATP-dependent RNA helicase RhlE